MSARSTRSEHPHLELRVVLLCIASGSLDAVTVLALGEAFASVMTGNIVFLGVAAGTADGSLAVSSVAALSGYVLGGSSGPGGPIGARPATPTRCGPLASPARWHSNSSCSSG